MSSDDDGFGPTGHQARDVLAYDSFAEHGTAEDVPDGSVGGAPHLLKLELLHTVLIGCDGGTLDTHVKTTHRLSSLHRHLVISGITVLNAQVIAATRNRFRSLNGVTECWRPYWKRPKLSDGDGGGAIG